MEGCDYNAAFPTGPYGSPDCLDRTAPDESRRQEKKKARKCRGPQATYLDRGYNMVGAIDTDPDRPAMKPMDPVPTLNPKTGMYVHQPVTQQYNYDTFVGGMDDLPAIRKNAKGQDALQSSDVPSFFGASPDDSSLSLVGKKGLTEGFKSEVAPFVNVIGDQNNNDGLLMDYTKYFAEKNRIAASSSNVSGSSPVDKETSFLTPTKYTPNSILPVPNLDIFWKENGLGGGSSSFFSHLKAPSGLPAGKEVDYDGAGVDVPASRKEVLTKLDKIFARLDDMDAAKSDNAQTEVLLFILTGLGVIFLMDIGCRAASSVAGRR
jgi:hypothetical protein